LARFLARLAVYVFWNFVLAFLLTHNEQPNAIPSRRNCNKNRNKVELKPKDKLDVFVYRDSEDRLVATTETPLATVGEFAYLKVVSVNRNIGAFLNWGLAKDLLLPFREQESPVRLGDSVIVHIGLDEKTNRIFASTRLNRHLSRDTPAYRDGQAVNLLILGRTPLGYP